MTFSNEPRLLLMRIPRSGLLLHYAHCWGYQYDSLMCPGQYPLYLRMYDKGDIFINGEACFVRILFAFHFLVYRKNMAKVCNILSAAADINIIKQKS